MFGIRGRCGSERAGDWWEEGRGPTVPTKETVPGVVGIREPSRLRVSGRSGVVSTVKEVLRRELTKHGVVGGVQGSVGTIDT